MPVPGAETWNRADFDSLLFAAVVDTAKGVTMTLIQ
jgi:hypothetical protein